MGLPEQLKTGLMETKSHVDVMFWTTLCGYLNNTVWLPGQHYGVTWTTLWGYMDNTMGLPEQLKTGGFKLRFTWMSYSRQLYGVTWTTLCGYLDNTMGLHGQHYGVT